MKTSLLTFFFLCTTFCSILSAQSKSDETEIKSFAQKYEAAYNQQDVEALKKMYLEDAVRVGTDGNEIKGADQIAAYFKDQFIKNKTTLTVNQKNLNWSDYHYAFVASGDYELKGATIVYDIKIDEKGTYENAMIKENGEWKIAKSFVSGSD